MDRLHSFCGHFLVAYGATADQRRQSRAELWQRQGSFTQAMLYPQTDCRDSYIVALTSEAAKLLNPDKAALVANLKNRPAIRAEARAVGARPRASRVPRKTHRTAEDAKSRACPSRRRACSAW